MSALEQNPQKSNIALICFGDAVGADGTAALPLGYHYGKPLLHHMIKSMENIGISRFILGIESIPAALLNYCDEAKREGLDVSFVREPQAFAAQIETGTLITVLCYDVMWSNIILQQALSQKRPLIATVEECPENQIYERIDLNNRWAGLAILKPSTLAALVELPEGWDMASALLRQGLQEDIPLWQVKNSNLQAGHICKISTLRDANLALENLLPEAEVSCRTVEKELLSRPVKLLLPSIWNVSWGRDAVEWSFLLLATAATIFAVLKLPIATQVLALFAVLSAFVRSRVHIVEYRAAIMDWVGVLGWSLLTVALMLLLYDFQSSIIDAIFHGATLVAISWLAGRLTSVNRYWLSSPLIISALGIVGGMFDRLETALRLLIIAQLIWLLIDTAKPQSKR